MLIHALHLPSSGPSRCVHLFSSGALAHGAVALYGLQEATVVPVELFAAERHLLPWRNDGTPLHVFLTLDADTLTHPAKAYVHPGLYLDEVNRNGQDGDLRGVLDALRPSVELGLRLWRVGMQRDGTPGPVMSALECSVWELEVYRDHLLELAVQGKRVARGCILSLRSDFILYVHARDADHAAELAIPVLQQRAEEELHQGKLSLLG